MAKKHTEIEPPADLFNKIMRRLNKEEQLLILKRRVFGFSVGVLAAMGLSVYSFHLMQNILAVSGFKAYFSLIFSDTLIVLNYWQSFLTSLLESFPAMETAVFLAAIVIGSELFKKLLKEIKNIKNLKINYGLK